MTVQLGAPELHKELVLIAGESFTWMKKLVKFANKGLIQIAHSTNNGVKAVLHFLGVSLFQIVVDQNDHGKRESLGRKHFDSLFHVVVKNAKFVFAEIRHEATGVVFHSYRQHHQIGSSP